MLFRTKKPEVSLIKNNTTRVVFSVRNGKALLRPGIIHDPNSDAGIHTLSWHGSPLMRFFSES